MIQVFIDGKEGTTGLQIYERLAKRKDLQIIQLSDEQRKDLKAREECLNSSDISFLCLPDEAARESVSLVHNPRVKIIDASTAHRTNPQWVYGFPELSEERRLEIIRSTRVANPGCHATGFISLVAPLIRGGILSADYPFVCHSLTGYSGAGKKTIAIYENQPRDKELDSPREYAIGLNHKHIPEMMRECGLTRKPIFNPVICDFYCGMCVVVPIFTDLLSKKWGVDDIRNFFAEYYATRNYVKVASCEENPPYLAANLLAGTNQLKIFVSGNAEQIFLAAVFDNLGKGASGAAIQNMNLMLGLDERTGLD